VAVSGSIAGSVEDASGAAIAGVGVTARHLDSGAQRASETHEAGEFHFTGLAIRRYSLRFEVPCSAPVVMGFFLVSVGQAVVQRVVM
jgi:hypothetical protein